jgi:hypothetical protein
MTNRDIDRYVRERQGLKTPGDREAERAADIRYRRDIKRRSDVYPLGTELAPGFNKGDASLTFQPTSSTGYARYIGRAVEALESVEILYRVTTIAATVTYAEWGLVSSEDLTIATGLTTNTMTTIGYDDISADIVGTGRKLSVIEDFAPPNVGLHLWLLLTVQATTTPILRGGVPQECGLMLSKAGSARPSTLAANADFTEVSTATNDVWFAFRQVQA